MTDTPFKFNFWTWLFGSGKEDWVKASSRAWKIFLVVAVGILLISGVMFIKNLLFPKPLGNANRQVQIALPWSGVKEQTSTNEQTVIMPQKTNHIGLFGGLNNHSTTNILGGENDKVNFFGGFAAWKDF